MRKRSWLLAAMFLGLSAACYHQVVQTGAAPSNKVVEKHFVATWLFGLVPAQDIDVRKECPTGVATVVTEQSFVNGLVTGLTVGIYTPQHVTITCALSTASLPKQRTELTISADASPAASAAVLRQAVVSVEESGIPVVLHF